MILQCRFDSYCRLQEQSYARAEYSRYADKSGAITTHYKTRRYWPQRRCDRLIFNQSIYTLTHIDFTYGKKDTGQILSLGLTLII